jgi:Caspase domain
VSWWCIRSALAVLCLTLCAWPVQSQELNSGGSSEQKIALVIGNARYPDAPLRNPVNDARAMANKLKQLGFQVTLLENTDNRDMARAIGAFGTAITKGGVGLFYYAGHGMQVRGRNFLVPIDAQIESEASVLVEGIEADSVLEQMAAAGNRLNIVILDACRNNPFERRFRGSSGGLAQTEAPTGALVAYATAPGKVASDGDGANGLYTGELLRVLDEPGLKVEDVFKRVRARVAGATDNQQVPWEASSLTGDFYFKTAAVQANISEPGQSNADNAAELAFWDSIKESKNPADYRAYLEAFPNGVFAPLARLRSKAGGGDAAAPSETTSTKENTDGTTTVSTAESANPGTAPATNATPSSTEAESAGRIAALPSSGAKLSGDEIRTVFAGNSVTGVSGGKSYTDFYMANGTIKGSRKGGKYGGYWRVEGDTICIDYQGTQFDSCYTIVLNGDRVRAFDESGAEGKNKARIVPGNPAGL